VLAASDGSFRAGLCLRACCPFRDRACDPRTDINLPEDRPVLPRRCVRTVVAFDGHVQAAPNKFIIRRVSPMKGFVIIGGRAGGGRTGASLRSGA